MLEFYGGLVTSMPPDEVVARVGTEYNPQVLYEMDRLLHEYAVAENRVQEGQALRKGHRIRWSARGICWSSSSGLTGYPTQLRPIFHAITDPLADQSRSTLGFALGDARVLADAYSAELTELRRNMVEEFRVLLDRIPSDADRETVIQHLAGHAAGVATFGAPAEDDLVGVLVERTNITRGEVAALVTALATPLGSQPHLTAMHETNSLRRRPIISFPDEPPLGIAGRLHPHRPGLGGRGLPPGHRVDQSVRPTATDHVRTTRLPSPGRSLQRARRPSGCHLLRRRATTGY